MNKSLRDRLGWLALGVSLLGACGGPGEELSDATPVLAESDSALQSSDVSVVLSTAQSSFDSADAVKLSVSFTNISPRPVSLLRWFMPLDGMEEPLFQVTLDGKPVPFLGPHYKRPMPAEVDYRRLHPGETISGPVILSDLYDLSRSGRYVVRFRVDRSKLHGSGKAGALLQSNEVSLWISGRANARLEADAPVYPLTANLSYTKCDATQQATVLQAVNAASNYANGATSYLGGPSSATSRYTTWFGAFSSAGWNTAASHFTSIKNAFDTKPVTVDCGCKKTYYAYVYPNQPYKIYVCKAFWSAPMTGTDSKGGTLIHEMSHFTATAGTDDWVYGQSGAQSLALSDPSQALDNADSHEYFAENNPSLP
ncbi:peptidase M35 [Myxococcaceae bacterium JPH2]|nr:peptidase M35 [Myxococcaceae bacterium JPH2]